LPAAPLFAAALLAGILSATAWTRPRDLDATAFAARTSFGGPNILLLVLDTVRADHLSLYGYERRTTPELERLLRLDDGAVVFPFAFATSNSTISSHVSLLTGLLASEHQSHSGNNVGVGMEGWAVELDETLGHRLGEAGYRTAGIIANPYLMLLDGPGRGFDLWIEAPRSVKFELGGERLLRLLYPRAYLNQAFPIANAASVNHALLGLLGHCEEGGCFIIANYMEAHAPYVPSTPYAGTFVAGSPRSVPQNVDMDDSPETAARAAAAYDEQILELDAHLGELLEALEARGLLDEMWLFITSDHGESFQEHESVRHATNIYNDQVRIPLVVQPPRGIRVPVSRPVGLLDVTATVSAIATGQPLGRGRDLRNADASGIAQMEFFGLRGDDVEYGAHSDLPSRGVVREDRKLIEMGGRRELYLLKNDPFERSDQARARPDETKILARDLPPLEIRDDRIRTGSAPVDRETIDMLRALGYVE
jgi:arylsulfatase A-like enzyme